MSNAIWQQVLAFDLDEPTAPYTFTMRLALEKKWTVTFTDNAILEYKKFMYLLAVSGESLSPSPIVDEVWHLHLTYSRSYDAFCAILGKDVKHVPSNHSPTDLLKLKRSVEKTKALYHLHFGPMPVVYWQLDNEMDANGFIFGKRPWWKSTFVTLLGAVLVGFPLYFLMKPIFIQWKSATFLPFYLVFFTLTFFILNFYNRKSYRRIWQQLEPENHLLNLHPFEWMALRKGFTANAINALINEAVKKNQLNINQNQQFEYNPNFTKISNEDGLIESMFFNHESRSFDYLFSNLKIQPYFKRFEVGTIELTRKFIQTKIFQRVYLVNIVVLTTVFLFGFLRLVTGAFRDKPIIFISLILVAFLIIAIFYLLSLPRSFFSEKVAGKHKNQTEQQKSKHPEWQWTAYTLGNAVLLSALLPLTRQNHDSGSSGASCSSSDGGGSSCSSCGGCGSD
jgi:hypothetical protein